MKMLFATFLAAMVAQGADFNVRAFGAKGDGAVKDTAAIQRAVDAANAAIRAGEPVTEETFRRYLYAPDVPDPDLVIRTSGELRTSNFLLWESAYSEYVFTDVLWPDFSEADLDRALADYAGRHRRRGGV